jgi:hypothetical protein
MHISRSALCLCMHVCSYMYVLVYIHAVHNTWAVSFVSVYMNVCMYVCVGLQSCHTWHMSRLAMHTSTYTKHRYSSSSSSPIFLRKGANQIQYFTHVCVQTCIRTHMYTHTGTARQADHLFSWEREPIKTNISPTYVYTHAYVHICTHTHVQLVVLLTYFPEKGNQSKSILHPRIFIHMNTYTHVHTHTHVQLVELLTYFPEKGSQERINLVCRYLYTHAYIHICTHTHERINLVCRYLHVWTCILRTLLCMSMHAYSWVWARSDQACVHIWVYLYVCVWLCVYIHVSVCVCMVVCVNLYWLCLCACVVTGSRCMYLCMCMYVCMYVCVWSSLHAYTNRLRNIPDRVCFCAGVIIGFQTLRIRYVYTFVCWKYICVYMHRFVCMSIFVCICIDFGSSGTCTHLCVESIFVCICIDLCVWVYLCVYV